MVVINVAVTNCQPQTIVIGRRGTYDTMQIAFDLSNLIDAYGNGVAVLAVKRSQDESAYPAVTTQADNTLTWTVSETDTAYVGAGECQLMWYVDGGLAKTIIYPMAVMRDILATSEEAPDAYQTWVDDLTALGAETLQNAQNAEQSASDAETAKDDANEAVLHYPKIENGYWYVWDVTAQAYQNTNIKAEGDDGYSPEVTITSIDGGHRITITDKDHPQGQTFDVMDGQGGSTGDYDELTNRPRINGHTLTGNQTAAQLGLATPSDIPTVPVQSVADKTGAVTLNAGDVGFNSSEEYNEGTVGAELSELNRQLSDLDGDVTDTQGMLATVETTTTASKNYSVGDLLVYDGKLYEVTSAIATGATIIVGSNVAQTTVETQIASGGGGGTGFPSWNHQYFEITSEAERTKYFEIPNTNTEINEFYVNGEVYFDTYDGIAVHSNDIPLHINNLSVNATNKYFSIRLWSSGNIYIGLGTVNQWGPISGTLNTLNAYMAINSFGNIRIGSFWHNHTMLEGTKINVWWR